MNKIRLWWKFEGQYMLRNIRIGLSKIWYWLPIIWKDRDWDSHYIYEILKHKLKAQSHYIGVRDIHTTAQQDARNMRICVNLIDKIQDDFYQMENSDYLEDRHWFEKCKDTPGYSTWESEILSETFDEYFKKYPLILKRVEKGEGVFNIDRKDQQEAKKAKAMNIGNINQKRAHTLLFKILQNNVDKWWD